MSEPEEGKRTFLGSAEDRDGAYELAASYAQKLADLHISGRLIAVREVRRGHWQVDLWTPAIPEQREGGDV
jgi:hypothetical protein